MAFCTLEGDEHYRDHFRPGIYVCAQCGYELFSSFTKYEHHSVWPAFTEPIHPDSVSKIPELDRPNAIEVYCGKCSQRLGHEFVKDRPDGKSRF